MLGRRFWCGLAGSGRVWSGLVGSGLIMSGHVRSGQVRSDPKVDRVGYEGTVAGLRKGRLLLSGALTVDADDGSACLRPCLWLVSKAGDSPCLGMRAAIWAALSGRQGVYIQPDMFTRWCWLTDPSWILLDRLPARK